MGKVHIFCDGGAIGNPGPAAIAAVIKFDSKTKKYSQFIGRATNNQAEYKALIFALKKLKQILGKKKAKETEVEVFVDSEVLAKQLQGKYKIKEKTLQNLFLQVWNLKIDFKNVNINHIHRERNKEADLLVKKALQEGR